MKCLICNGEAKLINKDMVVMENCCPKCGHFFYEKAFKTGFDAFLASQKKENQDKIIKQMKKEIKKQIVCFVDDFEKANFATGIYLELNDILDKVGLSFAHTNTIDSNYKD